MNDERRLEIEKAYREALFPLLMFSVEELEEHQAAIDESISRFNSFAPVLDPASYFTKRQSGELEWAEVQAEVTKHLLAARKSLQKLGAGGVLGLAQKVMLERAQGEMEEGD